MTATAPDSEVDICNLALSNIKQRPLVKSIDDPTNEDEERMALHYHMVRRSLLRHYVFNFSKARTTITRSGTPNHHWADEYRMPTDCLRVLAIGGEWEEDQTLAYDISGRDILLDNNGGASVNLTYIRDEEDVQLFDALFVDMFALKLALSVAYAYTTKPSVVQGVRQLLTDAELSAITVDGQEKRPIRIQRSKIQAKRRRGIHSVDDSRWIKFS